MHLKHLGRSENIPFLEKYKESTICAILSEKSHFGVYPEAKKELHVLRCAKNAPQRPQKMQIPRAYQKKKIIV